MAAAGFMDFILAASTSGVSTSDHFPKASRKFSKPWRLLMLRYLGGVNQQTILSWRRILRIQLRVLRKIQR